MLIRVCGGDAGYDEKACTVAESTKRVTVHDGTPLIVGSGAHRVGAAPADRGCRGLEPRWLPATLRCYRKRLAQTGPIDWAIETGSLRCALQTAQRPCCLAYSTAAAFGASAMCFAA